MKRFIESMLFTAPMCAALLFLSINPAAQARQASSVKELVGTVHVTYADLDLTQQTDVRILRGRIEHAAYRACGGDPRQHPSYDVIPRRTEVVFKECRADAIARALGTIDAPLLAARAQDTD